jgi:enoyl-CoA hydratase/carnithine racemase
MVAAAGGLFRLPRRISIGNALSMIATGDAISAERAFEIGLADQLVAPGEALHRAFSIAASVACNAPVAVRESLAVARAAQDLDTQALHMLSHEAALRNAATQDFQEGPRAFLEKRPPRWQGC